jgi:acetoacetyl-CoA synthetase
MMWNWQLSALASGVEIVTYDGPIDTVDRLWKLVARERVTVFGTSPGYLKMCEEAGLAPAAFGLDALRSVMSTGAVLHDSQFRWVTSQAKAVPVQSISGGTDIIGCFVLGHPELPVQPGEAQCRSLGLDVQAWQDGHATDGVGHLVCATPFPSRPLGFYGDADGSRFHAAYFVQNPGVWTHGDLIEFSAAGGARMHGRADGILNVRGTKFWPGEIYRVLATIPGILESMVVERSLDGESQVVALLVLAPGVMLDAELAGRVRREVGQQLSPAHVPDLVLDVPALPVTHNGKFSEAAARAAVNGRASDNLAALRNPECLDAIRGHPGLRQVTPAGEPADRSLVGQLGALWARHFGLAQVGPDDNFFELGGNSLLATRLLRAVQDLTGCALPLTALVQAPTVAQLARLIASHGPAPSPMLAPIREGEGTPLFLVHGLSGTVMECWSLVKAMHTTRPVWGLQARGLDGEQPPQRTVEQMATTYLAHLRTVQPRGPYALSGFSFGGLVAYEMAQQLVRAGEEVETLVLLDPYVRRDLGWLPRTAERTQHAARRFARMTPSQALAYVQGRLQHMALAARVQLGWSPPPRPSAGLGLPPAQELVYDALVDALAIYQPQPYAGPVLFVHAQDVLPGYLDPMPAWRRHVGRRLRVVELPGGHLELVSTHARRVAGLLDEALGTTVAA